MSDLRNEGAHIRVDYPFTASLSDTKAIKYRDAVEKYPDLIQLKWPDLILPAYDFREAQLKYYEHEHTFEMADGRCKVQLGAGYGDERIPEDLPMLHFEKECVVCKVSKKGINLCPECWLKIRKCLPQKHHLRRTRMARPQRGGGQE